jgi:isoleucyl-tRNA synthetase
VFFEGPPTANGRPGIHHVIGRAFKDLIPRFKTMQGFRVNRKAGWDTHGLPVELAVEKQLGLKSKKDIEKFGIAAFNAECKKSVWTYREEWQRLTQRMGYWLDLDNPYVTYQNEYVESVWWILNQVWSKGLLYEGYKVVPYCARCGTALSTHEVAQGYKEVEEESVYIRFKLKSEAASILAWTTTPWTLPSNTALAVGPDITYVRAQIGDETLIVAQDRLAVLGDDAKVISTLKGSELIGQEYEPIFSFLPLDKPAHRVVAGGFVTTADGTGIVHLAPFGIDDMDIIKEQNFPVLMTVGLDGAFVKEVEPWAGKFVKNTDADIILNLQSRGLLFKTEKYKHDYPFCWRCSTPLLYYPKNSWFIEMSKLRDKLVANGEKINWEPAHIKEGRFGEWLKGIKDWAISRERYWGTPLPIWKCEQGHVQAVGSLEGMEANRFRQNRFFAVRHGESEAMVNKTLSSWPEPNGGPSLTSKGIEEARAAAAKLKAEGIDIIVASDLKRTRETAEIIREATGIEIVYDERLREISFGEFNGQSWDAYHTYYSNHENRFVKRPEGGENYTDVRKRVMECALEYDRKYAGKKIALVSHRDPIWFLAAGAQGVWSDGLWDLKEAAEIKPGDCLEVKIPNWPFDDEGTVDVHRPYIDRVTLKCRECGGEAKRIPEVLDVWFDSGAMPLAQWHYPKGANSIAKVDGVDGRPAEAYPADFICEGLDQTRGWFYTMLAISTLLDREPPYKNAICLGLILDSKGLKMSKSKGNIVDPWAMFTKYGADATRFLFYTVSAAGEPKRFDEKDVDGVIKKVFLIMWNCLSFWKMHAAGAPAVAEAPVVTDELDHWILSELARLTDTVTSGLEKYDVTTSGRAIADFVNDLSTWYVRRSRDRFKDGDAVAIQTLGHVLLTLAKIMAPFTPFVADGLYRELGGKQESVHLEDWPKTIKHDADLSLRMRRVREVASRGLEKRSAAGINVRQALAKLTLTAEFGLDDWMKAMIAAEVNVKEVAVVKGTATEVELDTTLTPELKREGAARDLTRHLNSLRKEAGLTIEDRVTIRFETDSKFWQEVFGEHGETLKSAARATGLEVGQSEAVLKSTEVEFDGEKTWIGIEKS